MPDNPMGKIEFTVTSWKKKGTYCLVITKLHSLTKMEDIKKALNDKGFIVTHIINL